MDSHNTSMSPCLRVRKSAPNADTSALESMIDEIVFDLYNLTPEEREIVKGGGK